MFERFDLLVGKDKREKLNDKTVVIIGIGGVGGYVAESLARSGIGHLILVDHDIVDVTNKNRQLIALDSTISLKKTEVLKNRILDINSSCTIDIHDVFLTSENISLLDLYKIDYLVDACDTLSTKKTLIDKCIEDKINFISSMGTGKRLDPSMLEITTLDKTSYDPIAKILRKYVREQNIKKKIKVLCSREQPKKIESTKVASCCFVPSSAGLLIGSYIIREFLKD